MADNSDQPRDAPDWWDDVERAERADLMVSNETRREYFRIERPEWDGPRGAWVDLKDVPWNKKKEVLSDCIEAHEDGSGELDLAQYYRDILDFMIDDASFGFQNAATLLRGLNNESGDKLESFAPRPSARGLTEEEEGKSGGRSGDGTDSAGSQ